jgi:choline dehydrogenase-like flavoprotein
MKDEYDYIIVGAGITGSVIAEIMTTNYDCSILVLEMGKDHLDDPRVQDAKNLFVADNDPDITEEYLSIRNTHLHGDRMDLSTGRGWGGSSSNNHMIATRPSRQWLEQLESMTGIPALDIETNLRISEKYITSIGLTDVTRGKSGPMSISQLGLGKTFADMSTDDTPGVTIDLNLLVSDVYSVPVVTDYNLPFSDIFTSEKYQVFAENDGVDWLRQETGKQYLANASYPNGMGIPVIVNGKCEERRIRVIDRAKVTKINFKNCGDYSNPCSVVAYVDNTCCTFAAKCGVIISAGTIETPSLLQRSGIGPSTILDSLSIPCIVGNEHVGRNLLGQTGTILRYLPDDKDNSYLSMVSYVDDGSSLIGLPTCIYPGGTRGYPVRTLEFLGYSDPLISDINTAIDITHLVPREYGDISIVSLDSFTKPRIKLPALTTSTERMALIHAYRDMATQVNTMGINVTWPCGDPTLLTDVQILGLIIREAYQRNLSGTARMGNIGSSVVDRLFQVYGTKGLYVVDASIIPIPFDCQPEWFLVSLGIFFANKLMSKCKRRVCHDPPLEMFTRNRLIICRICTSTPCKCNTTCEIIPYVPCHDLPCSPIGRREKCKKCKKCVSKCICPCRNKCVKCKKYNCICNGKSKCIKCLKIKCVCFKIDESGRCVKCMMIKCCCGRLYIEKDRYYIEKNSGIDMVSTPSPYFVDFE